jgi:hypothetical protein
LSSNIQDAVLDFIRAQWPFETKRRKITPHLTLNDDLGMDGDDAVEFFEAFAEKFSVDLKQLGEEWNLYFNPEGVSLFGTPDGLLTLFTAPSQPPVGRKLPLLIERVVHAAEIGRWQKLQDARESVE